MGTNYYWTPTNSLGFPSPSSLHIGKISGGWQFMFQGYTPESLKQRWAHRPDAHELPSEYTIKSWEQWKALILSGGIVSDEYDHTLRAEDFIEMVELRSPGKLVQGNPLPNALLALREDPRHRDDPQWHDEERNWLDDRGFCFSIANFS